MERVLVTGGCGFIGWALCRYLVGSGHVQVHNVDKMTYAATSEAVAMLADDEAYRFTQGDIGDLALLERVFAEFEPTAVVHLAAESHVDRSIRNSGAFVTTNVVGTYTLLEVALAYWTGLRTRGQEDFRFLHVSTDEVFGSLGEEGRFSETTPHDPSSPYSASKAAADHLVNAWHRTYGLPTLITNCSNNFGPFQFPEKLIPLMIISGIEGRPLPVYGDGRNVRDWLYVDDHVAALKSVLEGGEPGATYTVGARNEHSNIEVVRTICRLLDAARPRHAPHERLITYVLDRPGHDRRYAIDPSRIERELHWRPQTSFGGALDTTVRWYLNHESWWRNLLDRTLSNFAD